VLAAAGGETVMDLYHGTQFRRVDYATVGEIGRVDPFASTYLAALREQVDADRIRAANFTVLIDPVGGAACAWLQPFAEALGLRLVGINAQPSGYLAREPEPRPRAATQMAAIIGAVHGHAGFVLSSDAGRMSLVTEAGEPVSEEMTFPLIAEHVLRKSAGPVITNCCTTRTLDDVAARHGVPVIRTPVGQGYVAAALADEGGRIGGEGSGAAALPAFGPAFDGFLMMALTLDAMAASGQSLSALLAGLPRYHIVKKRISCESRQMYRVIEDLRDVLAGEGDGRVDTTDGIRVDWDNGWVHVRASRTEQIIRVISEDRDRAAAAERAERIARRIEQRIL
jgi:phosphomannomutase